MYKLIGWLLRCIVIGAAGLTVFLVLTYTATHHVVAGQVEAGGQTFSCSIANVAAYYGISMVADSSPVPAAAIAEINSDLKVRAPAATVLADNVSRLQSLQIAVVNGHRALVRQLTDMPDGVILGPAGNDGIPAHVTCGVAFYDADSGEFLIDFEKLEPIDSGPVTN
jgi:hypothetical protein